MTTDPRLEPLLRSWLKERVSVPPPSGLTDTLELLGSTPQRRPSGLRTWTTSHRLLHAAPLDRQWRLVFLLLALALAMGALLVAGGASPSQVDQVVRLTATTDAPGIERMTAYLGSMEMRDDWAREVEVGADGSIFILGQSGLMKVGAAGVHLAPSSLRNTAAVRFDPTDLTVDPRGAALVSGWGHLERYDGSDWTSFAPPDRNAIQAVDVAPDGTPWTMWTSIAALTSSDLDMGNYAPTVGWLDGDDLVALPTPIGPAASLDRYGRYFAVTADGSPWLGVATHSTKEPELWRGLVTWDGEAWTVVRPIVAGQDVQAGPLAAGPDGTLWVYFDACVADGVYFAPQKDDCSHAGDGWAYHTWLGRFDGTTWKVFSEADGVPKLTGTSTYEATLKVGPEGTLWMGVETELVPPVGIGTSDDGCPGVFSFDGTAWHQYLAGECVSDLAIAPDGTVWANSVGHSTDALYRIDPAAAP